jgi:multiple sugar transport system permease protein
MINQTQANENNAILDNEPVAIVPTPGKPVLKIVGLLYVVAAIACLIFGILGLMGVCLTDTFYLDNAITEGRTLNANLDGVPMWTQESWENLQDRLIDGRTVVNDRSSTQEQINQAYVNLRSAIENMVPSEAFAHMEVAAFLPDGRTVSTFFMYLIVLFFILSISGILAIKLSGKIKKMHLLGIFGIISFFSIAFLIIYAVYTLGYELFPFFLPSILLPIAYLAGVLRNNRKTSLIIIFSILIVLAGIVLFPLWWIIRSSLMYLHEVPSMKFFPTSWVFSNYPRALERFLYFTYLRNTLIIAVPAVVLGTSTAILCAYSFARLKFRGKKFMFGLVISSMLLPPVVTLIPLFIMFTNFFGLTNSFWPLIIPWICGGGAFNIFLLRQFFLTLPTELDEAAMIDGAGRLRILTQILLPSLKPAIMVVAIFIFMLIWNDLLTQMVYLHDENLHTMAMGLRVFSGSYGTEWHLTMVATVLSIIPGLLVYIVGQKYLVEGIVMTGMKN